MRGFGITASLTAMVFSVGCVSFEGRGSEVPTGQNGYQLFFVQRSTTEYRTQAHYLLLTRGNGQPIATFASNIKVDERGVDNHPMRVGEDFHPQASFSPSGRTLLITEDCWEAIPNDRYLLVRLRPGATVESFYIRIPVGPNSPPENLYPAQPEVKSLSDESVVVGYWHGGERSFELQRLERIEVGGFSPSDGM